ncbi:MAG: substrate-binding domain-containing protein [Oscillospiraceae bacterium]|nr:substrate-binding domain-containing protein [Oscillospiraceae bacterium]
MKSLKKLLTAAMALMLIVALIPAIPASAADIKLIIDGIEVKTTVPPFVEGGTTFVPLRAATEFLGAEVSWNGTSRQATIKTAGYVVVFTIGSRDFTVNGVRKTSVQAAQLKNGSTMIPIRALSEAIGADVSYSATPTPTATIKYFTNMKGNVVVTGSTTVQPIMQAAADYLIGKNTGLSISVAGGGSGTGKNDTKSGSNNIGMSSSAMSADDMRELDAFIVAKDAVAIIVHPSNPVKGLTKQQAIDIFTGKIKNWKDVGGNNAPILVQTREAGSGTLDTVQSLLLGSGNSIVTTATPHSSSGLLLNAVAGNANAIGYDSIGYLNNTVKALTLDNVTPSRATVQNGAYAISRDLWVFTKGRPTGVYAMLIDFLRSDYCQNNITVPAGYVAIR